MVQSMTDQLAALHRLALFDQHLGQMQVGADQTLAVVNQDQAALEVTRFQFDNTNQRIAELIWPSNALFLRQDSVQGERRDENSFDSTAAVPATTIMMIHKARPDLRKRA